MKKISVIFMMLLFAMQGIGQDLPDWFFNPPKSNSNTFYTIGISDPGLTREQAEKQAELRAMYIFVTLHNVSYGFSGVSEKSRTSEAILEAMTRGMIKTSLPELYFEIVKKDFTINNEALVLLKVTFYDLTSEMAMDSVIIKAVMEDYSNESYSEEKGSSKSRKFQYQSRIISKNKKWVSDDGYVAYQYISATSDSLVVISNFGYLSKTIRIDKKTHIADDYMYQMHMKSPVKQYNSIFPNQVESSAPLRRGLWYAFCTSMISGINKSLPLTYSKIASGKANKYKLFLSLDNLQLKKDSLFLSLNSTDALLTDIYTYSAYDNVDKNIPRRPKPYPYRYALIIGNEDYSSFQSDLKNEVNVAFAVNDANVFKEYVQYTLGVPEENIILLRNANAIDMHRAIQKICLLIKNLNGKAEVFVYYAGHGLPDEKTREAYIIPCDVTGSDLQFAIKLNDLYAKFSEYPSKRVTVFLDACFSGGARNQSLVENRGVKIKPNEDILKGNIVVFTASSGEQSALPYTQKNHGLFTYFLLKKLQESKGELSYRELSDFLTEEIGVNSLIINNKEQNSKTLTGPQLSDTWKEWTFQ